MLFNHILIRLLTDVTKEKILSLDGLQKTDFILHFKLYVTWGKIPRVCYMKYFSVLRQFNLYHNLQLKANLKHSIKFTFPVFLPMNLQYL